MPISLDLVTFGLLALSGITAASFAVAHRRPLLGAFALLISALSVAALMAIFLRAPIAAVALISLQGALAAAIYVFSVSTLDDGQLAGQIDKGRTGPSRARAVAVGAVTAGFVIMVAVAFFDAGSSMRIVPEPQTARAETSSPRGLSSLLSLPVSSCSPRSSESFRA